MHGNKLYIYLPILNVIFCLRLGSRFAEAEKDLTSTTVTTTRFRFQGYSFSPLQHSLLIAAFARIFSRSIRLYNWPRLRGDWSLIFFIDIPCVGRLPTKSQRASILPNCRALVTLYYSYVYPISGLVIAPGRYYRKFTFLTVARFDPEPYGQNANATCLKLYTSTTIVICILMRFINGMWRT